MTNLVIGAAIASIAITAILTFLLWRMNKPMLDRNKRDGGGGDGGAPVYTTSDRRDVDHDAGDGGGSDGGGDGGGD